MRTAQTQSEVKTISDNDVAMRLDVPTIQARTAHYPDELREAVLWIANYLREECARDLDILTDQARKLGVEFDKTTWSKVLRGRWDRNAEGNPLPSPVVSLPKLLRGIEQIRRDASLKEAAGKVPFIVTPTAQMIWDFIDKKRAPDRINKFGLISGHTGTQKTASTKEYCRRNNHGTCVHTDAPETPSLSQFVTDLADKYGCSRQANWDRKRNTIRQSVNERRCVIVENVQRLFDEKQGSNQRVFSFLQKLQDDTGCTIIMTLTPVFATKLERGIAEGYFEQFLGRAGGVKDILGLDEYPEEEDVLAIAQGFGLVDAPRHLVELTKIAREPGRVRVLFEVLQEAKIQAKGNLTINHVRAVRLED